MNYRRTEFVLVTGENDTFKVLKVECTAVKEGLSYEAAKVEVDKRNLKAFDPTSHVYCVNCQKEIRKHDQSVIDEDPKYDFWWHVWSMSDRCNPRNYSRPERAEPDKILMRELVGR